MVYDKIKRILTINSGSSSIKFSLYRLSASSGAVINFGSLERIGLTGGVFLVKDPEGGVEVRESLDMPDHGVSLRRLFAWLKERHKGAQPDAVGHRVVHGGSRYHNPSLIDPEMMQVLKRLVYFAPEHLPHQIKAIETVRAHYPELTQIACFDTAFHRSMPKVAQMYPLPRDLFQEGIIRYGFHGLSYEYIINELQAVDPKAAMGRVIIAHLGNGASMAAVKEGRGVDTTMGFTPTGGLMMSTRSGDLDPGAVLYILKEKGLKADEINELLNRRSGILGVSGISPYMEDVIAKVKEDPRAEEAVALFSYQAKKFLGALASVLGGLDTLVFTGGMGENSPEVRRRICDGMEFLGLTLDDNGNSANSPVISGDKSMVKAMVIRTNEELMIARHTYRLAGRFFRIQQS